MDLKRKITFRTLCVCEFQEIFVIGYRRAASVGPSLSPQAVKQKNVDNVNDYSDPPQTVWHHSSVLWAALESQLEENED